MAGHDRRGLEWRPLKHRQRQHDDPKPFDGRDSATRVISAMAQRFPDLIPVQPDERGLDQREAAFAHHLVDSVVRRWSLLTWLIRPYLNVRFGELEPRMRAVLLVGSAQLVLLDRVPAHAALDQSVEWAKRWIRPGAAGMVNAVLRRVAESVSGTDDEWTDGLDQVVLPDGRAARLAKAMLPADRMKRASVQSGVPSELLERWAAKVGEDKARAAALHAVSRPPITLNTRFAGDITAPELTPHEIEGHHVLTGEASGVGLLLDRFGGAAWVQDAASTAAVQKVADLEPKTVIDVCAGQGTKTRQLLATFPGARVIAAEVDEARLRELKRVFGGNERVGVRHADQLMPDLAGQADLVLLDVPCSNTGVFARRAEAKYRWGARQTERLNEIQRQIVASAIPLLSPSGCFVYSTCSLEPEENEHIAKWAANWHRMRIERESRIWPTGLPGEDLRRAHDGSYSVLLRP